MSAFGHEEEEGRNDQIKATISQNKIQIIRGLL